jgi:choline monooxygenase
VTGGWTFEPDLSRARTLPADLYVDPAALAAERRRVFARTWQPAGAASDVSTPGAFVAAEVAGEPVVIVRDAAGNLRALSNVCRHRAGPVARGAGSAKALRCGYHGWTYGLDGALLATPEWDGVRDFDPAAHRLPEFRAETWGPFVFVNLDGAAPPLADFLGAIGAETRGLPLDRLRPARRVDYEVACNWKVYVDNYLEGYHIPIVHPELFRLLDYRAYRVETARFHSKQHALLRAEGGDGEALYYWLFPNVMVNVYPGNLQTNVVLPLGPDRTLTRFEWFALDPDRPDVAEELARAFALSDVVQREDMEICEAVQKGLASATYPGGRYSVLRENGVHHFHGLLARFLGDGAAAV